MTGKITKKAVEKGYNPHIKKPDPYARLMTSVTSFDVNIRIFEMCLRQNNVQKRSGFDDFDG